MDDYTACVVSVDWHIVLFFVARVGDDTSYQKKFLATDLAFLIEKLQTSPGDAAFAYTSGKASLKEYTFSFSDSLVRVADKKQRTLIVPSRFTTTAGVTLDLPDQQDAATLYFAKDQQHVQLVDKITFTSLQDDPCAAVLRDADKIFSDEQRTLVLISDTPEAHLLSSQIATAVSDDLFQQKKLITVKDMISYDRSLLSLDDDLVLFLHVTSQNSPDDHVAIRYGMTTQKEKASAFSCRFVQAFREHDFLVRSPEQSSAIFLQENLNGIALGLDIALSDHSSYKDPSLIAALIRDVLSSTVVDQGGVS